MRDVFIIGIGQTPVGEHWDLGMRDLGAMAIESALGDAGMETVDALYVGNMLSGAVNGQENLATLVADGAGLLPVEAMKVEAACASGGACVRAATLAVASGAQDVALAVGLEKMTDGLPKNVTAGLATASDQDFEASHGFSFVALSALIMRRYLHEHGVTRPAFAPFVVNAHANACGNPNAMFRQPISVEDFSRSPLVSSPISILDASPVCDGAAAVVVCSLGMLRPEHEPVRIVASAAATDTISLGARRDVIALESARQSAARCFEAAGMRPEQMDLFEAHDAFSIITALSLEACGFAGRGEALRLAEGGDISRSGSIPLSTMGGLKARGHPVGASGTYQIVEASLQLRGRAGDCQLAEARRALTQSIGGHGSVAVTHILEA